jgi:hypothetical protein
VIAGIGLGLLVSQLNNYTLSPIVEERSASGRCQLGRRFLGCHSAGVRRRDHAGHARFSFTNLAEQSTVLTRRSNSSAALEEDAEVMTNTPSTPCWSQPPDVKAEMIRITPSTAFALQALLIPIIASVLGLLTCSG